MVSILWPVAAAVAAVPELPVLIVVGLAVMLAGFLLVVVYWGLVQWMAQ